MVGRVVRILAVYHAGASNDNGQQVAHALLNYVNAVELSRKPVTCLVEFIFAAQNYKYKKVS